MGNTYKVDERFSNIKVYCKDRAESVEFEGIMHKNGWTWGSGNRYFIRDNNSITEVTFYDFDRVEKTFTGRKVKETGKSVVNYATNKFGLLNTIFNKKPSYEPRKVERTLESLKQYPYRFKTEKEFIDSFGHDWRRYIHDNGPNWADEMDHLFGKDFPYDESQINQNDDTYPINDRWDDPDSEYNWMISWDMLTKNTPRVPNYSPKKIERTLESVSDENFSLRYDRYKKELDKGAHLYVKTNTNREIDIFYEVLKKHPKIKFESSIEDRMNDWKNNPYDGESFYFSLKNHPLGGFRVDCLTHDNNGLEEYPQWMMDMSDRNMIRLLFGVSFVPNYNPKKTERTLESFSDDTESRYDRYKHELDKGNIYLYVRTKNNQEIDDFYELLKNSKNIRFVGLDKNIMDDYKKDPYDSFYFSFKPNYIGGFDVGYLIHRTDGVDIYPYWMMDVSDTYIIRKLFGVTGKPSYEPKNFDRTLESVEQKYKYIVVQVENKKETDAVLSMLRSISPDFGKGQYEMEYPNWIFIDLDKNNNYYCSALIWSTSSNERGAMGYIKNENNKVNPKIYTVRELLKVKSMITGKSYEPSYEPRKIKKTLESFLLEQFVNKYKYDVITVKVDTPEESERIQNLCFENGIPWGNGHMKVMYVAYGHFPDYLTIILGDFLGQPSIAHGSYAPRRQDWYGTRMDETIYTINDYEKVRDILKYGKVNARPTYSPRKTSREI